MCNRRRTIGHRHKEGSGQISEGWERYEPPLDYETLTGKAQLLELCRLKLAVYATEVYLPNNGSLRLFLWQVAEGQPAHRYDYELTIRGQLAESLRLSLELGTSARKSGDGIGGYNRVDLFDTSIPDAACDRFADALETATALPGPPMSTYFYPDWVARREACMRGRIPESLLTR